ncbi:MAG: hypothetical protein H6612_06975 [Ignavibacteriales bacterium]|nr:hypothetical protein [Ignavibacteriales bacterium]MCB9259087.1 hypothetical protein [Ignavibacteriales bacterium]
MNNLKNTLFLIFLILTETFSQSLPENAILKNFHPFTTPRTNGRPGEVYRIDENGVKFIVQDVTAIKAKTSDEGDLVGRMYFTSDELLSLLNLEFDRLDTVPAEVKIVKAIREYTEQTTVDKVLYDDDKARELIVDPNSSYYMVREAILSKDITFRFSHEVVKKIKKGAAGLTEIKSEEELDFPFEIQKKFKSEKRIFYLQQAIHIDPYDE